MRAVDRELQKLKVRDTPRADMVAIHMNRIILHFVFKDSEVRRHLSPDKTVEDLAVHARKATEPVFLKVAAYLEAHHPTDYLANFCKNTPKCEELARALGSEATLRPAAQPDLFASD